jgi:predicted Zn finger-like uncharacterized protein
MFTICPKCALTLLVTAEDLRVAQGYVRCGRCSSVFNALARLTEERQELGGPPESAPAQPSVEESPAPTPPPPASARARARASDAAPSPSPPPPPPPGVSDEDAIPDDALEFDPTRTDVSSVFVEPPPNPQWSAATGTFKAMMAAPPLERSSAQQESARARKRPQDSPRPEAAPATDPDPDIEVEIGMEMLASILHVEPPAEPPAPASPRTASTAPVTPSAPREPSAMVRRLRGRPSERPPVKEPAPAAAPSADLVPQQPPTAPQRPAPSTPAAAAPAPTPAEPDAAPAAPTFKRVLRIVRPTGGEWLVSLAWGAGTVVAALVMLAQIVNHYRDELAANARFNRPLTAIYAALGVHLMPRWDVKAYDVRQLGASVEPGGAGLITVRASVKNAAAQPQPLPLLRVTLQDRFGNRIAARDVGPRFYLARGAPGFLSAGERIDAEMGFVDPGANAVGFEIDACLPTSDGAVTCANDTASR